jgi:predicted CopG family antitoxin
MHNARMPTKTISVKLEAYERLRNARRYPGESFSEVVLRATWPGQTVTGRELLRLCQERGPLLAPEALDRVERLKQTDAPPPDKWNGR